MPEVFERHLRAASSSDLTPRGGQCDIDMLTAAGAAAQRHELGMALYAAKYQGSTTQTELLLRSLYRLARSFMHAQRIRGDSLALAREVLLWWLDDRCPACEGRKLQVIPDTARLSAKPCAACHGTGLKPLTGENYEARQFVACEIDILVDAARAAMAKRGR